MQAFGEAEIFKIRASQFGSRDERSEKMVVERVSLITTIRMRVGGLPPRQAASPNLVMRGGVVTFRGD